MKVLLLHQHFKTPYKGGAIRSYYLAKALVDRGIDVTVITGHNDPYTKENIDGIDVLYLSVPYDNSYGAARRIQSFLRFANKATALAKSLTQVDLCYAISVPLTVGLVALRLKRKFGIPFVFEVGDLWPEAPIQLGFINNYFVKRSLYALEKRIYNAAESVVALSPAIKLEITKKTPGKVVHMLPNMADTDFFRKERIKKDDKFVVSYIGALGIANGLDFFIACANAARKASLPIHFILCGAGAEKKRLENLVNSTKLENITILDFANREGVREVLKVTDAALISYKPVPILETGSPNKFFDALAAGKLVVINFDGWIKEEIESARCGISVDAYDPSDFVRKIKPFINDPALLERYQNNGRALAESKYSRSILSEQFASIIKGTRAAAQPL
ncbi:MAG: glycosyltransferase family 4 protein [Cyclobacteriaceae bacterium]|nr:glycosyltransferase family 4 protein [Cyclobacteriaceae bacterium]